MLTPLSSRLVFSALGLVSAGILMGNLLLVYMGAMPLVMLLTGLLLASPSPPREAPLNVKETHYVGDVVRLSRGIRVDEGLGPVLVGEELPKFFELDEGSNIRLLWKGPAPLAAELKYSVRCTRRGVYELDVFHWEKRHLTGLTVTGSGESPVKQTLIVQTYPLQVKKIRQQKVFSNIPMPSEAQVKLGIPTTEFKEIREYISGDPFKNINWKATSRRGHLGKPPMVNQFEMEGMKIVWLFLNTSPNMAMGTSVSNSLEYAIQAIMGLSQFYLGCNCRVGVSLYDDQKTLRRKLRREPGAGVGRVRMMADFSPLSGSEAVSSYYLEKSDDFIVPDLGKKQLTLITKSMLEAEVSRGVFNLEQSVVSSRGHISGGNPLFYIVTSVSRANIGSLERGIRELMRYTTQSRRTGSPIVVVHVQGYKVKARGETERAAADVLEIENQLLFNRLRRRGISVVTWDPTRHRFTDVLLRQVRRRRG